MWNHFEQIFILTTLFHQLEPPLVSKKRPIKRKHTPSEIQECFWKLFCLIVSFGIFVLKISFGHPAVCAVEHLNLTVVCVRERVFGWTGVIEKREGEGRPQRWSDIPFLTPVHSMSSLAKNIFSKIIIFNGTIFLLKNIYLPFSFRLSTGKKCLRFLIVFTYIFSSIRSLLLRPSGEQHRFMNRQGKKYFKFISVVKLNLKSGQWFLESICSEVFVFYFYENFSL